MAAHFKPRVFGVPAPKGTALKLVPPAQAGKALSPALKSALETATLPAVKKIILGAKGVISIRPPSGQIILAGENGPKPKPKPPAAPPDSALLARAVARLEGTAVAKAAGPVAKAWAAPPDPNAMKKAALQDLVIYLDEVPMVARPALPPSYTDREVFVESFPGEADSAEEKAWLEAAGDVDKLHRLPGHTGAYVKFKTPDDAARCVSLGSGVWSESERALTGKPLTYKRGVHCAYPCSLLSIFGGEGGVRLREIQAKSGVTQFRIVPAGVAQVHFTARGTKDQLEVAKALLEECLMTAHQDLVPRVEEAACCGIIVAGIPEEWALDEVKSLFTSHGEVTRVELENPRSCGRATVEFESATVARLAAEKIDATDLGQESGKMLRCHLKAPWNPGVNQPVPTVPEIQRAVVVGNLPFTAEEGFLRDLFGKAGEVMALRLPMNRDQTAPVGYAFVVYSDKETASKALEELQESDYCGRRLLVLLADSEEGKTLVASKVEKGGAPKSRQKHGGHEQGPLSSAPGATRTARTLGARGHGGATRSQLRDQLWRESTGRASRLPGPPPEPRPGRSAGSTPGAFGRQDYLGPQRRTSRSRSPRGGGARTSPWERKLDPSSGAWYYWNHLTLQPEWVAPFDPAGFWERVFDARTNIWYFWNSVLMQSRWDDPFAAAVAEAHAAAGGGGKARPTVAPRLKRAAGGSEGDDRSGSEGAVPRPNQRPSFSEQGIAHAVTHSVRTATGEKLHRRRRRGKKKRRHNSNSPRPYVDEDQPPSDGAGSRDRSRSAEVSDASAAPPRSASEAFRERYRDEAEDLRTQPFTTPLGANPALMAWVKPL